MSQGKIFSVRTIWRYGRNSSKAQDQKGREIQASSDPSNNDVININDVISPPIFYKRAVKTVNLDTKHAGTSEDRSILHPQGISCIPDTS